MYIFNFVMNLSQRAIRFLESASKLRENVEANLH
jgi:hypothetical protein